MVYSIRAQRTILKHHLHPAYAYLHTHLLSRLRRSLRSGNPLLLVSVQRIQRKTGGTYRTNHSGKNSLDHRLDLLPGHGHLESPATTRGDQLEGSYELPFLHLLCG